MLKTTTKTIATLILLALLVQYSSPAPLRAQDEPINFSASGLQGADVNNPTSLQFGPDGRLYVSQQDGIIYAYTIGRVDQADYQITAIETIDLIQTGIPNHNDDGTANSTQKRQVTGILVSGSASQPVLYVTSSDWRIGGGNSGSDSGLDTNSGVLSRLTWDATNQVWDKVDLVRGLPRSEENHATNGLVIDAAANQLYISSGGSTNGGAPSFKLAKITEYALSAAILKVDLNALEAMPILGSGTDQYVYDLPTVDDPTRSNSGPGGADEGDPFGGNDGLNQAKIVLNGPVQVHASGFRNAYDLLLTTSGQLYSIDNGGNAGWGGFPENEGATGLCTNEYNPSEPGSTSSHPNGDDTIKNRDTLHLISGPGYYAGHPNPIRGNPTGAGLFTDIDGVSSFRTSPSGPDPLPADWPPVPPQLADPVQCDFRNPGVDDGALTYWEDSTNGMTEYTASNFGGALQGDILAAGFQGNNIWRIMISADGSEVTNDSDDGKHRVTFASGFGATPLDVTAQADGDIFPGTVWAATYGADAITVFEPADYDGSTGATCTGADNATLDEDGDGYTNNDEIDNGSDPCSAASIPPDNDGDLTSDLNDADDDNDGLPDTSDYFAIDPNNGTTTNIPLAYSLLNNDPGTGFFGLGFTGLMSNGSDDYLDLFDADNLIAGGAVGLFTITNVTDGDALETRNNQRDAFQFGLNVNAGTPPFRVRANVVGPLFAPVDAPAGSMAHGLYLGTGDQDNFIRVALVAHDGGGALQVLQESDGVLTIVAQLDLPDLLAAQDIDFTITVDPAAGTVQAMAVIAGGPPQNIGAPIQMGDTLSNAVAETGTAVAIGLIASARDASPFNATWDLIEVSFVPNAGGEWTSVTTVDGSAPAPRHEASYVAAGDLFYLIGGRYGRPLEVFDPAALRWTEASAPPRSFHHFQAVTFDGLIYVIGAFEGNYPDEVPLDKVYIYDPSSDEWTEGAEIPTARRRGSGGVAVYGDKIYWVGGLQNGHIDGWVPWLDAFDPATETWTILADAPRERDHFSAAVIGDSLYVAGGRKTGFEGSLFDKTVAEVDAYDFADGTWSTATNLLPTERAGATTVGVGNELIIIGGESSIPDFAHPETEAFNVTTGKWRTLDALIEGRHGMGAVFYNGAIYIAAGAGKRGSSPELFTQERLSFATLVPVPTPTTIPIATPLPTQPPTPSPTLSPTLSPTPFPTPTNSPTNSPTAPPIATETPLPTSTETATAVPIPTETATATVTPQPPTPTDTATTKPTDIIAATPVPIVQPTAIQPADPAVKSTVQPTDLPAGTAISVTPILVTSTPMAQITATPLPTTLVSITPLSTRAPQPTNTPAPNQPPVIQPQGSAVLSVTVDEEITLTVVASDPEGGTITLFGDMLPEQAEFVDFGEGTGRITWTPTLSDLGSRQITVMAVDVEGAAITQRFTVVVEAEHSFFMPFVLLDAGE